MEHSIVKELIRDFRSVRCDLKIDVCEVSNRFGDTGEITDVGVFGNGFRLNEFDRCRLLDTGVEKVEV